MHKLIADEPYELSPDAAKLVDEVNTAWDAAQELRRQHKIEAERLDGIDPLKFKSADSQAKRKNRELAIKVLQIEIPLLARLDAWRDIRRRERHAAYDRAIKRCEDAIEVVKNKLREIGFDAGVFAEIATKSGVATSAQTAINAAESGMGEATYFHPTVAPHNFEAAHLNNMRHATDDLSPATIEARIASSETVLRNLIAQL